MEQEHNCKWRGNQIILTSFRFESCTFYIYISISVKIRHKIRITSVTRLLKHRRLIIINLFYYELEWKTFGGSSWKSSVNNFWYCGSVKASKGYSRASSIRCAFRNGRELDLTIILRIHWYLCLFFFLLTFSNKLTQHCVYSHYLQFWSIR